MNFKICLNALLQAYWSMFILKCSRGNNTIQMAQNSHCMLTVISCFLLQIHVHVHPCQWQKINKYTADWLSMWRPVEASPWYFAMCLEHWIIHLIKNSNSMLLPLPLYWRYMYIHAVICCLKQIPHWLKTKHAEKQRLKTFKHAWSIAPSTWQNFPSIRFISLSLPLH